MSTDDQPRDFVFWFLELIALGCVLVAVEERFAPGDIRSGVRWLIAGLLIGGVGFTWRQLLALVASIPRIKIVVIPKRRPIDLVEEGRQRAARQQIRHHVADIVRKFVLPTHEATDKALRACVGQLRNDARLVKELVLVYEILVADTQVRVGQLNVAANRSLQDAPEESKPSVEALVETLVETTAHLFRLCGLLDSMRMLPDVLLRPVPELITWKDAIEQLRGELRQTSEFEGFGAVRRLSAVLRSSVIPVGAPRIVPVRYGASRDRARLGAEGLFVENHGGPARRVVVAPIRLGARTVSFTGPEITQLKREDGERFLETNVEVEKVNSPDLFDPFRQWQKEVGDLTRETVGIITYSDFDSVRYETFFRLGVDIRNTDGGMVVEFIEQRLL